MINTCKTKARKDRFKLKMNQPRYIVQPQSKVVVCIMECSIPHLPYFSHIMDKFPEISVPNYSFTVKGTAKCGPDDIYDEKIGMRISESRAKYKALNKAWKIMQHYWPMVQEELEVIVNSMNFFDRELDREAHHIEGLIGH